MSYSFKKSLLATTVFVGVAGLATPAFAQDAQGQIPAEDVQTAPAEAVQPAPIDPGQEIIVTGTLIRNPNLEQSSPVTVVGAEEIELQQANVAEELLRELPAAVPSIGSAVNNGNGGASFVNLRGLGTNRNLVLLDGTRVVPAGLGGVVDLNNIPLALVERVDVLTGGAVTTYGADAVSGVVNFITKNDFAGAELNVSNQITERGDGHTIRADLTVGANFDDGRGNAAVSVGYQQADPIYQGAREISRFNVDSYSGAVGGGSGTTVPGRYSGIRLDPNDTAADSTGRQGTYQVNPGTGGFSPTFQTFNFNPANIFQTPFERFNIFGTASYEVADGIEVYNQGLFSKNSVSTIIAASGGFGNGLVVPLSNPYLTDLQRRQFCAFDVSPAVRDAAGNIVSDVYVPRFTPAECAAAATATSPTDPNFRTVTTAAFRRFTEAGPRFSEYTTTIFQNKIGVRGDITQSIGFDIFGLYGESENIQRQSGNGLLSRLEQAAFATNPNTCIDTTGGCVPINLFGPEGSITQEQLGFLTGVTTSGATQTSLSQVRGVVSGDFGVGSPLATEVIGFAVGGEYRRYTASSVSDLATQTPGEVLGNGAASPDTFGEYDVREAFAEVIIPLIADRPFFHSLTIEGGIRYSDYSTAGTSTTYKAGGSWEPIDSFKIRGSYNRATRAPNISELFSPPVTGLDNLAVDPCAGAGPNTNANLRAVCLAQGAPANTIGSILNPSAGQPNITVGGNLALEVEKATTFTVGAVFQPDFIPGLALTVDYYDIKVEDAITTPAIGDVVNACFGNLTAASAADPACTSIRRNPLTGGLDGSVATTPGVPLPLSNLGEIETNGIDATLNYRRDLGFAGLNFSFNGNWTDKARFQATPSAINRECVGFYSANCASLQPEFSFNARTTLTFGAVDVSLLWRYMDSFEFEPQQFQDDLDSALGAPASCPDPLGADPGGCVIQEEFRTIGERHYFDLSTRYELTDNFALTFTVQNLFDKEPPLVGASAGSTSYNSGNTFPSSYDALGRRYAVGARLSF